VLYDPDCDPVRVVSFLPPVTGEDEDPRKRSPWCSHIDSQAFTKFPTIALLHVQFDQ
jgi:hypothetical protein